MDVEWLLVQQALFVSLPMLALRKVRCTFAFALGT